MARVVPLFSGSKGNCYYIGTAAEGVLIDAGRSCKQIEMAMEANGLSMKSVAAVFVTHEHIDHCQGLRVLTKKNKLPVFASAGTLNALAAKNYLFEGGKNEVITSEIALGNMKIQRVNTSHDAAESCCYRVTAPDGKVAMIATDLGFVSEPIRAALARCDFVVLESNHDVDMLRTGPYPYPLKRRILSDIGHLSNDACAVELAQLVGSGTCRLKRLHPRHRTLQSHHKERDILMQKVNILCIGKIKEKYFSQAIDEYAKRLQAFCKLRIIELAEEKIRGNNPNSAQIAEVLQAEGKRIMQKISPSDYVIALCIEGKLRTSEELAGTLNTLAVTGRSTVDFVIGGSYGLSDEVKAAADEKLSMSRMTFPHTMARMILTEQIYRAYEIASNGKYHK